jgi:hypothetical protein
VITDVELKQLSLGELDLDMVASRGVVVQLEFARNICTL